MRKAVFVLALMCFACVGLCKDNYAPKPQPPIPINGNDAGRIEHLRQAAVHLEAAGLAEEAQKIRRMIGSENSPAVMVQISLIEISLEKLKQLGFDYTKLEPNSPIKAAITGQDYEVKHVNFDASLLPNGSYGMLKSDDPYFSVLKVLRKDGLAKTLASPTIVAQSGQEASCHIGGQNFPVSIKSGIKPEELAKLNAAIEKIKNSGTKVEVLPVVLDGQTIHLKVRGCFSELDKKHTANIAGISLPAVKTREFCTTCNIKDGYVAVLKGLTTEQSALIVLIKAEIVKPDQTAMKPPPGLLE